MSWKPRAPQSAWSSPEQADVGQSMESPPLFSPGLSQGFNYFSSWEEPSVGSVENGVAHKGSPKGRASSQSLHYMNKLMLFNVLFWVCGVLFFFVRLFLFHLFIYFFNWECSKANAIRKELWQHMWLLFFHFPALRRAMRSSACNLNHNAHHLIILTWRRCLSTTTSARKLMNHFTALTTTRTEQIPVLKHFHKCSLWEAAGDGTEIAAH